MESTDELAAALRAFARKRGDAMRGVINGKDVLRHSVLICRLWGVRTYLRCLRAALSNAPSTFLEIVSGERLRRAP